MSALGIVVRDPETNVIKGQIALLLAGREIGIEIVPNPYKRTEDQPDFRISSGASDLGAGWIKTGKESQREYVSLRIFHPEILRRPIYANLGRAAGQDDDDVFAVIVNAVD